MTRQGLSWPEEFQCENLPTSDCFDPWVTETNVDECEPITVPMCNHALSYTLTKMPNLLNHQDQRTASDALQVWNTAISVECHPKIREYLCSFYTPSCDNAAHIRYALLDLDSDYVFLYQSFL